MNGIDILLIVLIAAIVIAAILALRRNKKRGRPCCGDCASCGQSCNEQKPQNGSRD